MANLTAEKFETSLDQPGQHSQRAGSPSDNPISIVCISDLFWDEHWSSEQQIMSRLSQRCQVLYVERPVSIFSSLTGVSDASIWRQWLRWLRGGLRQEGENLTILTPPPVLPLRYKSIANRINNWLLRRSVKRALRKTGLTSPVLWIYSPDAAKLVGTLGESYSLYYCADDWSASKQWWNDSSNILARESELASKVDLVVGTSTKIVKRWEGSHANTLLVTNGADVESFTAARNSDIPIPEDLAGIPSPRIGYVGCIDSRFDTDLYMKLATNRPEWHFVIVGPVTGTTASIAPLKGLANVHFIGSRSRTELPAYLKYFDVCTIPYVCDKLAESIFPLKFFEYLSAGRPIVSTALPELLPFSRYAHIADTPKSFEQSIDTSLQSPLPAASESFLAQNSWEAKADLLWNSLAVAAIRGKSPEQL